MANLGLYIGQLGWLTPQQATEVMFDEVAA